MRRLALIAAVGVLAACGGGEDEGEARRQALAVYLRDANIQLQGSAAALADAEETLREFSLEPDEAKRSGERLDDVLSTLVELRGRLAQLQPPSDAAALHRLTLQLLDRQAALASDLRALAAYLPRAGRILADGNVLRTRMAAEFERATTASEQANAAEAFAREARPVIDAFATLRPPQLLSEWQDDQLAVLRAIRAHAVALAAALEAGDAAAVNAALDGFERAGRAAASAVRAQAAGIRAFNAKVRAQRELVARIRKEQGRLDASVR